MVNFCSYCNMAVASSMMEQHHSSQSHQVAVMNEEGRKWKCAHFPTVQMSDERFIRTRSLWETFHFAWQEKGSIYKTDSAKKREKQPVKSHTNASTANDRASEIAAAEVAAVPQYSTVVGSELPSTSIQAAQSLAEETPERSTSSNVPSLQESIRKLLLNSAASVSELPPPNILVQSVSGQDKPLLESHYSRIANVEVDGCWPTDRASQKFLRNYEIVRPESNSSRSGTRENSIASEAPATVQGISSRHLPLLRRTNPKKLIVGYEFSEKKKLREKPRTANVGCETRSSQKLPSKGEFGSPGYNLFGGCSYSLAPENPIVSATPEAAPVQRNSTPEFADNVCKCSPRTFNFCTLRSGAEPPEAIFSQVLGTQLYAAIQGTNASVPEFSQTEDFQDWLSELRDVEDADLGTRTLATELSPKETSANCFCALEECNVSENTSLIWRFPLPPDTELVQHIQEIPARLGLLLTSQPGSGSQPKPVPSFREKLCALAARISPDTDLEAFLISATMQKEFRKKMHICEGMAASKRYMQFIRDIRDCGCGSDADICDLGVKRSEVDLDASDHMKKPALDDLFRTLIA